MALALAASPAAAGEPPSAASADNPVANAIFRIAEIEVKPEYLDAYLAAAADVFRKTP